MTQPMSIKRERLRVPAPRGRFLIDLAGPTVFVTVYLATGRLTESTWALCVGSTVAIAVGYALDRRFAPIPVAIACGTALSATLSSVFSDPRVITLEATVSHVIAGSVLLGGLAFQFNVLKLVFGDYVCLPNATWTRLAVRFGLFALVIACANEVIRDTQPEAVWVAFKVVGFRVLHLLFLLLQVPMIVRDRNRETQEISPQRRTRRPPISTTRIRHPWSPARSVPSLCRPALRGASPISTASG